MKTFSFSPFIPTIAAAIVLAGCAGTPSNNNEAGPMAIGMCSPDKDHAGKGGCPCCNIEKNGMSSGMKDKHMGMTQGNMPAQAGAMCMPAKDAKDKSSCPSCGIDDGGCKCCGGMDKKGMSPEMHKEMHKKHMEMMQDKMPPKPADK